MSALLEIKDLEVAYGKILAVKGISFTVGEGEVVCLIGTNGAGKTTTLRTISGLLRPKSGEIWFQGTRIDKVPAHEIVSLGVAHSPEGRRIDWAARLASARLASAFFFTSSLGGT
jgi:branched-chain amino acid transport system ATP-binding protein